MISYKNILNREFYYLDFESNKAGDLFLLGIEHNKNFTCYVINEDLSFLCDNENYVTNFNVKFENYKSLNYSVIHLDSHLYKIISYPLYLVLITIFSAIIMLNIGYRKNTFFKITYGIFLSVIIYYINYFFNILGTNEKIPLLLSIILPLIILTIINFISIIKLNE